MLTQIVQDIVRPLQPDGQFAVLLLQLLAGGLGRPVIRHRGRLDHRVLLSADRGHRLKHLPGAHDRPEIHKTRPLKARWPADERHPGPAPGSRPGDGIAHLPAGMVRQTAHRVQCLLRRPGGHQDLLPRQVLRAGDLLENVVQKHLRLRHLARPHVAAGQVTYNRVDHMHTIGCAYPQVILGDRIFIHLGIHGRRDVFRALAGQKCGREHIVGQPVGHLGDHIGRGRRQHEDIGPFRQGHMLDAELEIPVKGVHQALIAGQCLKCHRRDEPRRVFGQDHLHVGAQLLQRAGQGRDLIGGDAAADPEYDCFTGQHKKTSRMSFPEYRPHSITAGNHCKDRPGAQIKIL